jgi:hypothetical protein
VRRRLKISVCVAGWRRVMHGMRVREGKFEGQEGLL